MLLQIYNVAYWLLTDVWLSDQITSASRFRQFASMKTLTSHFAYLLVSSHESIMKLFVLFVHLNGGRSKSLAMGLK